MRNATRLAVGLLLLTACGHATPTAGPADVLLAGGTIYDGTGGHPFGADLAVRGDRIVFIGDAGAAGVEARDTLAAEGLVLTPGFIDMHSHAELDRDYGHDARHFLHQGITTVVLGVDGAGTNRLTERFSGWLEHGIGVNALQYVGHNAARTAVMGTKPGRRRRRSWRP
jgi:N-acyl-D-amino-acid deacylase